MFRKKYILHQKFKAKHPIVDVMAFRHEVDVNTLERTKCIIDIKKIEKENRDIECDISKLTPLEQSYHFIPAFHSYNPSGDQSKIDNKKYCQHCLCPTYYCANTMFGYDMLHLKVTFFGREKNYSIILNISSMHSFSEIHFKIFNRTYVFSFLFTL